MFLIVFQQLFKMLILLVVGIICIRIGLVGEEGRKNISDLLLMLVNPCVIISVYQTDYNSEMTKGLLLSFVLAVAAHLLGFLFFRLLHRNQNGPRPGLEECAATYSNCGFIGIPLINSVLGSEGVFYLSAYMAVFNIICWTHGLARMKEEKFNLANLKEGLKAPMLITTVAAMILYFLQIRIPPVIMDPLNYLADMNTPMAMLVAGFCVAGSSFSSILKNRRIYWVSFLKLIAFPLLVLAFLSFVPVSETIAYTILIAAACPTATTVTMMAIRYDRDYVYASEIFSFTTVLSVVTIPLIVMAASFIL